MRWWMVPWLVMLSAVAGVLPVAPARAGLISERQELQMGAEAAQQIESESHVSKDRQRTALVESIGRKLAAVSSRPKLPWKFAVLEASEVNAVSVPAHVYVNSGLLDFVGNNREELAAVIAHEVAHTTRKHAARQAEKQMIGSLALSLLLKNQKGLTTQLAGVAANLAMLGYSRQDELEADRYGAEYLIAAGYDPNAMVRFFRKLQAKEGKESGGLANYFRTHPPTSERIKKVQQYIDTRERQNQLHGALPRLAPARG